MPVNEVEREEGYDPNDPMAVRFRWVTQGNQVLRKLAGNTHACPWK